MKTTLTFLGMLLAVLTAHAGLEISSVSVTPAAATAGQSISGLVSLSEGCKYSAGCTVSLKSSNGAVASVPASAIISFGGTTKAFSFIAGSTSGSATITASFEGKSASTSMSVSGGTATPTPLCTASSSRSCTISNGAGSQTCNSSGSAWGSCSAVSCNSGYSLSNGSCVAQQNSASSEKLNVFQLSGNDGTLGASSGGQVQIFANLLNPCPSTAGCRIDFTSSHPAILPVPASITIGYQYIGYTIYATAGIVSQPTTVSVTASAGGVSKTLSTTIFPGAVPPAVMHMYFRGDGYYSPVTGQIIEMQLNMQGPCPIGGCLVNMSSSNTTAAPVPAQVLVPEGQSSVSFFVKAGLVSTKSVVKITASFYGQSWDSASTFTVRPPWPRNADGSISMVAITQNPGATQVVSNDIQQARAWRAGLNSLMYEDVRINLYNQCQAAFAGNGQLVGTSEPTKLPTTSNGYNIYYSYTQNYICKAGYTGWLQAVTTSVGAVTVSQAFTVTACLNKAAPGNVVVAFTSSTSAARVPSSATIPAGQQCVTINVTTNSLSDGYAGVDAIITAKLNGLWLSAVKTVYYE